LHHYPASPFAEKIRLMLGYKGLAWRSVRIPEILPKPDVVALTGGYRRTPVLQIGADIYCDTRLIASILEQTKPQPSIFAGNALTHIAMVDWAESALFNIAVPLAFQGAGLKVMFPDWDEAMFQRFRDDRAAMRKGGTVRRGPPHECWANLVWIQHSLDAQLLDGRPFLLGDRVSAVDFAVYHPLWPLRRVQSVAEVPFPFASHVLAWMDRMAAFGHGEAKPMSSGEAIGVARSAQPLPVTGAVAVSVGDVKLGDEVEVVPVDYAFDVVRGKLIKVDVGRIWVRREDSRAGLLMVHFPRRGYELRRAS